MATSGDIAGVTDFTVVEGRSRGFYVLVAALALVVAAGLWAAHVMDTEGHHVTGMTNQIVWGIPHVFAVFLIVTASGALNVASMSSVMGRKMYAPYARLSALLAIALLMGGLAIITLDLGRPDRLMVALTHFNFTSVFAWNVIFYTGFIALSALYLWTLMDRPMGRFTRPVGAVLLVWRITLTTATGLIFGVLVAREAYDVAIMAPMFIAMSLSFGTAACLLLLVAAFDWTGRSLDDAVVGGLRGLLAIFVVVVLYFVVVFHAVKLYAVGYQGVERFLLADGGAITALFWLGQIAAGSVLPLILLLWRATASSRAWVSAAAALVLLGGLAQLYVIVIGGQAYPLEIFPGKEIIESSFHDGVVAHYTPSGWELMLALGGVALALLVGGAGHAGAAVPAAPRRDGRRRLSVAHLYVSAAHKSSGKTVIATGLCAALARRGVAVQPFKKGPDYIDPMWLGRAAGRPCRNLDFFTMAPAEIVAACRVHGARADVSIIEGTKGLHDGVAVDGVASGEEGVDFVAAQNAGDDPYEVVYLDWRMPGIDGIEAGRRMMALPIPHKPGRVMVTAYGRPEVLEEAEQSGIAVSVTKPATPSSLLDAAMLVMGQSRRTDGSDVHADWTRGLEPLRGARLLLVEDNELNQQVATELLTEAGFVVDVAENGQVAVRMAHGKPYDCVLMDIQMPVMDGYTATKEIRKEARLSGLPIVAMTANAMAEDREASRAAGMNAHVAKPIDPDELFATLREWIPEHHTGVVPSAGPAAPPRASSEPSLVAAGTPDPLRAIPDLDVDETLRRLLGKRELYEQLLREFAHGAEAHAVTRIRTQLAEDDRASARNTAHSLKGVAGNLGARTIHASAGQLEAALASGDDGVDLEPLLSAVDETLTPVVDAIRRVLPVDDADTDAIDPGAVDWEQARTVVDQLVGLLETNNAGAVDVFTEQRDLLRHALADAFGSVETPLNDWNFPGALAALQTARAANTHLQHAVS